MFITAILDAFRIVTLGSYTFALAKFTSEFVLVGLQFGIVLVSILYVIFEVFVPQKLGEKSDDVQADELHSSTIGKLLFGWLWKLLEFGKSKKLSEDDLKHVDYHPDVVYRENQAISAPDVARKFYRRAFLQYTCAAILKLLGAVATLGQPLIIGEITRYLTSSSNLYTGVWLIIAMFLE